MKTLRIDFTEDELKKLLEFIDFEKLELDIAGIDRFSKIIEKLESPKHIEWSVEKALAASRATDARTKIAKAKINDAMYNLRQENKKVTHYSISQKSGVSYNTVKKYISLDEMK